MLNDTLHRVTERIIERSAETRADYLAQVEAARRQGPHRSELSCGNLAHGFAAHDAEGKKALAGGERPNIAIVSAYNDMLSAHQPLGDYPPLLKAAAWKAGGFAQFAGGVPAMCDGVTQGQPGMDLSLFSRDVIAMATAVALSHNMFDGALCLGVCDKIVPGLVIGALAFGHLPVIFVPAGPMTSGMTNAAKAQARQLYAQGKIGREELLDAESKSYHSPGTCTFYGTANSNQLLMEFMGLQLPGTSFVNPHTRLRGALTRAAAERAVAISGLSDDYTPMARVFDEKALVNGIVGLLSSGGSTNHTIHLVAMGAAAGIQINWDDLSELSGVTPLLARVYPNGQADVNHFEAAGGIPFMIRELLSAGLLHEDVHTIAGEGLSHYTQEAVLGDPDDNGLDTVRWQPGRDASMDEDVLRPAADAFAPTGGLKLMQGNLGRAMTKTSAVDPSRHVIEAPVRVFNSQHAVVDAFKAGELDRDVIVVVLYQGPRANGMPELHKLLPPLGVLQDRGFRVALVTDGRMSGASGKVPSAIQVCPEALAGGPLAKLRDGDIVTLDATRGVLEAHVSAETLAAREPALACDPSHEIGMGRELFAAMRRIASNPEAGGNALPIDRSVVRNGVTADV
ncbi:MAG: phosphogluconate dehydratase [Pseudomonadota bacterium]